MIVNYRAGALVVACLASLAQERKALPGLTAVVVDNPGGDDSLAVLRAAIADNGWSDWVTLRPMPKNGGFAYGINAGVQPALGSHDPPDAFLLLNPDTWVRPGAVVELTRFLASRPDVGMAGSRLEDEDGTVQHSRFRFPSLASQLDEGLALGVVSRLFAARITAPPLVDHPHAIDWLSGACMLVRADVFRRVGLFDEGYFLYFEELDFARRAHALGITSWYVPQSRVVHLVGRSTGVTVRDRRPDRTPAYWFVSRNRYFRKHHGRFYKLAADVLFTGGKAVWHCLRLLRGRRDNGPPRFLRDFVRHNFWFGNRAART